MIKTITLSLPVNITDEYLDDYPTHLKVVIDNKTRLWINKMARYIKKQDLDHIAKTDWSPDFFKGDDDDDTLIEYESGTECEKIFVRDTDFFWGGLVKHTCVHYESDTVTIKQLNKYFRHLSKPLEEMPKYLNDEDEILKTIATQRMAEGV